MIDLYIDRRFTVTFLFVWYSVSLTGFPYVVKKGFFFSIMGHLCTYAKTELTLVLLFLFLIYTSIKYDCFNRFQ